MSYNPLNPNGQATGANSQPVVVASDQSAIDTNHAKVAGTTTSVNNGTTDAGTQRVTLSSDSTGQVVARGNVASGATDSGNPVKIGGVYNSSAPTFTNGQRGDLQLDAAGNLKTTMGSGASVSINDGSTTASNVAGDTGQNAQLVAGSRKEVSFSFTTASSGTGVDASNYRWISIHITSQMTGSSPNLVWECSNDNTNFVAMQLLNANSSVSSTGSSTGSSAAVFYGSIPTRYVRLRTTGSGLSGTTAGIMEFFATPNAYSTMGVNSAQVAGTAITTNTGTSSGGTQRVVIATDQPSFTNAMPVNLAPTNSGGWSVSSQTNLTTTATVSGSAGKFAGYMFINLNATPAYLQVFDTTGAVTLGTTTPTFVVPLPANSTAANGAGANLELANGIAMASGIKVAATTTATGATTVTTGLTGFVLYK